MDIETFLEAMRNDDRNGATFMVLLVFLLATIVYLRWIVLLAALLIALYLLRHRLDRLCQTWAQRLEEKLPVLKTRRQTVIARK